MRSTRTLLCSILLVLGVGLSSSALAQPMASEGPLLQQPRFAPPPPAAAATRLAKTPQPGQPLFVQWGGSYWPARVVAPVDVDRVVIHYQGWGNQWDEIAGRERWAFETPLRSRSQVGDRLFVEWGGSYWPARVLAVQGSQLRIRYEGYGSEWDELVGPGRVKQLQLPAVQRPAVAELRVGDAVMVLWGGRYWPATVIAVQSNGRYQIHYDGWGTEWDEVVALDRIRSR